MKNYLVLFSIFAISLLIFPTVALTQSQSAYKTSNENKHNWGFILKKSFYFRAAEFFDNISIDNITWFAGAALEYNVFGVGRHQIRAEFDYTVYTYDDRVPQPQKGTIYRNDTLYLFDLHQQPIVKQKISGTGFGITFYLYNTGTYTGRFYIDDVLIGEKNYSYTHH